MSFGIVFGALAEESTVERICGWGAGADASLCGTGGGLWGCRAVGVSGGVRGNAGVAGTKKAAKAA